MALCAAFDLNPADYTLLGVMADAADENGEPEVAECLRFLWKHRQVPILYEGHYGWFEWGGLKLSRFLGKAPALQNKDNPVRAVWRVTEAWPQHKQLLIDALEPVCTT